MRIPSIAFSVFRVAAATGLVALAACSGSGAAVGGPSPTDDQTPGFNEQNPSFDEQQQAPITARGLCLSLCDAVRACIPPGADCLAFCLGSGLGQFNLDACLGEDDGQRPPTSGPNEPPDPGPLPCTPASQCQQCEDACTECLCSTGGDTVACTMQCSPPEPCTMESQCQQCSDTCAECLCLNGGDMPACESQGLCPAM